MSQGRTSTERQFRRPGAGWRTPRWLAGLVACTLFLPCAADAHRSVARAWNEALLDAIRLDYARPTVHARNLFHTAIALYDAWAAYDDTAQPVLLGRTVAGFHCGFEGVPTPTDIDAARAEAMSYAAYRLLSNRFFASPGVLRAEADFDSLMILGGYDVNFRGRDYGSGEPAALGNYLARCIEDFGLQDGSREGFFFQGLDYEPVNPPLFPILPGNPELVDPNRWQPLTLELFIDQAGNPLDDGTPPFLGPEWGRVTPFAMTGDDRVAYGRDGATFPVWHDPGAPPPLRDDALGLDDDYKWNFALVASWSAHLDPADGVMLDISPGALGNIDIDDLPTTPAQLRSFYDLLAGGDPGRGYAENPRTGQPYAPQRVPRGDYARVLAEFWADGPASETPPGHWFTILNYVHDHPLFERRWRGEGDVVDPLEWDVKAYLALGGAVHDAAVAAWSIKGWYDYVRPISAIRYMADRGQSTDPAGPSWNPRGLPLIPGRIEVIAAGDSLAGDRGQHVGKIKLYAWRGSAAILDVRTERAGVGWIRAEDWWPYQRPSFVTPPFAGYVSGHSTFSRAAAEVLTALTGDPFFPGGLGEFRAPAHEFLVFEDGPSVDVTLQWATYRDASDQTSLSRIWGGIHPPADDIPGRIIGARIGVDAFAFAESLFRGDAPEDDGDGTSPGETALAAWPNPVRRGTAVTVDLDGAGDGTLRLYNVLGQIVARRAARGVEGVSVATEALAPGLYFAGFAPADGAPPPRPARILILD